MSVRVSGLVWDSAPVKSGELVVLLAMADNAHDDGGGIYPSQEYLAKKSRMTERQVRNCLKSLEEKRLIRKCGATAKGIVVWRIVLENFSGGKPVAGEPGSQLPTEPSGNHQLIGTGADASSEKPVSYRSKRVPPPVVEEATRLLGVFNEVTERDVGARTGAGDASPALKQILGAMLARPGVSPDRWEAAIRNVAANPPSWAEESGIQIGTVFGERAAEHALTNSGAKAKELERRTAKDPAKAKRVDDFMAALRAAA